MYGPWVNLSFLSFSNRSLISFSVLIFIVSFCYMQAAYLYFVAFGPPLNLSIYSHIEDRIWLTVSIKLGNILHARLFRVSRVALVLFLECFSHSLYCFLFIQLLLLFCFTPLLNLLVVFFYTLVSRVNQTFNPFDFTLNFVW
jgi:hypothetical protein